MQTDAVNCLNKIQLEACSSEAKKYLMINSRFSVGKTVQT